MEQASAQQLVNQWSNYADDNDRSRLVSLRRALESLLPDDAATAALSTPSGAVVGAVSATKLFVFQPTGAGDDVATTCVALDLARLDALTVRERLLRTHWGDKFRQRDWALHHPGGPTKFTTSGPFEAEESPFVRALTAAASWTLPSS